MDETIAVPRNSLIHLMREFFNTLADTYSEHMARFLFLRAASSVVNAESAKLIVQKFENDRNRLKEYMKREEEKKKSLPKIVL